MPFNHRFGRADIQSKPIQRALMKCTQYSSDATRRWHNVTKVDRITHKKYVRQDKGCRWCGVMLHRRGVSIDTVSIFFFFLFIWWFVCTLCSPASFTKLWLKIGRLRSWLFFMAAAQTTAATSRLLFPKHFLIVWKMWVRDSDDEGWGEYCPEVNFFRWGPRRSETRALWQQQEIDPIMSPSINFT